MFVYIKRGWKSFDVDDDHNITLYSNNSNNTMRRREGKKSLLFFFCYSSEGIYTSFIVVKRRRVKIIVFSGGDGGCRRETSATERPVAKVTGVGGGKVPGVEEEVPEAWTLFNLKRIIHTRTTQTDGPRSFSA